MREIPTLKFVTEIQAENGRIVGMCEHQGKIIIATERGKIFTLQYDWVRDEYSTMEVPMKVEGT